MNRELADVRRAARRIESGRFALAVAVRKAHQEGHTLRAIGAAAGLSYETVRRICQ